MGSETYTWDEIYENGEIVFSISWDAKRPAYGAETEYIYRYQGAYYGLFTFEEEPVGPFDSLIEAVEEIEMAQINETCESIDTELPTGELMKLLTWTGNEGEEHKISINGKQWQVDGMGKFAPIA